MARNEFDCKTANCKKRVAYVRREATAAAYSRAPDEDRRERTVTMYLTCEDEHVNGYPVVVV